MRKILLYFISLACISVKAQDTPIADILDVVFNIDGTAVDVSPMHNTVEFKGEGPTIAYSATFGRNVATFHTKWSTKPSGYYKIDFENNQEFRDAIADGHSLEILVMPNYEGALQDVEVKPFSAMQAGGTGFLICKTRNGGGKNSFTFLPNVSSPDISTWRWATSGITPMVGFYYHVIGVWNKEEAKAYIYVNGELCNTVDARGEFRFANEGCNWFCVGGDASGSGAEAAWEGDIVIARIYDKPLIGEEVAKLWNMVKEYAMGKCAKPSINYENGRIKCTCKTEGVTYSYTITPNSSSGTSTNGEISLGMTFNVSVYAQRENYFNSEVATTTISLADVGDINGDGKLSVEDVAKLVDLIMKKE